MEAICVRVYTVKMPPDTLPPWRQFGCRECDLRPPIDMDLEMPTTADTGILSIAIKIGNK